MQNDSQENPVRRKVLDTSFYAFNQRGYKGVPMDVVARELRISKKTIYVHFESKEEILETALEELFSQVHKKVSEAVNRSDEMDAVMGIFQAYQFLNHSFTPRLRNEIRSTMPHIEDRILAYERRVIHQKISKWFKALRKSNVLVYPSPTRELSATMVQLMRGLLDAPADKVQYLLQSMIRGMQIDGGGRSGKKKKK